MSDEILNNENQNEEESSGYEIDITKYDYTQHDYSGLFDRVKKILKDKIVPVVQGSAKVFRDSVNGAIGTVPKFNDTGAITEDGDGMSGAVYAMGEELQQGMEDLDTSLGDFCTDAVNLLTQFQKDKSEIFSDFENKTIDSLQDFSDRKDEAIAGFNKEVYGDKQTGELGLINKANAVFEGIKTEQQAAVDTYNEELKDVQKLKNETQTLKTEAQSALTLANTTKAQAESALAKATQAESKVNTLIANTETYEATAKTAAENASGYASSASQSADIASASAETARDKLNTLEADFQDEAIQQAKDYLADVTQAAQTAADNANAAKDAISGKVNNFLVVSQASQNNKPMDSNGNEIEQMPGGIWFKILPDAVNNETSTESVT